MKTKSQTGLSFNAYKNYKSTNPDVLADDEMLKTENGTYKFFTEEEFINKIKTDSQFAKKWGNFNYNETVNTKREMKTITETGLSFAFGELIKLIPKGNESKMLSILLKAVEIEKKQILDAWNDGRFDSEKHFDDAEQYYNVIYNTNEE